MHAAPLLMHRGILITLGNWDREPEQDGTLGSFLLFMLSRYIVYFIVCIMIILLKLVLINHYYLWINLLVHYFMYIRVFIHLHGCGAHLEHGHTYVPPITIIYLLYYES